MNKTVVAYGLVIGLFCAGHAILNPEHQHTKYVPTAQEVAHDERIEQLASNAQKADFVKYMKSGRWTFQECLDARQTEYRREKAELPRNDDTAVIGVLIFNQDYPCQK